MVVGSFNVNFYLTFQFSNKTPAWNDSLTYIPFEWHPITMIQLNLKKVNKWEHENILVYAININNTFLGLLAVKVQMLKCDFCCESNDFLKHLISYSKFIRNQFGMNLIYWTSTNIIFSSYCLWFLKLYFLIVTLCWIQFMYISWLHCIKTINNTVYSLIDGHVTFWRGGAFIGGCYGRSV